MKKVFSIFAVLLLIALKAQSVSDYQYVVIPAEFATLKETYGMEGILKKALAAKQYTVLPEEKNNWPADALSHPCKVITADILNEKSLLRNKISLQFKDCSNKVIYSEKSGSMIKEFEPGFQDAMRQAALKLPVANPKDMVTEMAPAQVNVAAAKEVESVKSDAAEPSKTSSAQRFSNGKVMLQKIQIDDSQFILVDGNSSTPFATFKKTAKNDVFRVKLNSGESTLGYFENGNIVIEMPKGSDFVNEVFKAQ